MVKFGRLLQESLILLLRIYSYLLGPFFGASCRFYPSCSKYSIDALSYHGLRIGLFFTIKRLLRCHPWSLGGYDPVLLLRTLNEPKE